jgi:hypothetical protein
MHTTAIFYRYGSLCYALSLAKYFLPFLFYFIFCDTLRQVVPELACTSLCEKQKGIKEHTHEAFCYCQ